MANVFPRVQKHVSGFIQCVVLVTAMIRRRIKFLSTKTDLKQVFNKRLVNNRQSLITKFNNLWSTETISHEKGAANRNIDVQ